MKKLTQSLMLIGIVIMTNACKSQLSIPKAISETDKPKAFVSDDYELFDLIGKVKSVTISYWEYTWVGNNCALCSGEVFPSSWKGYLKTINIDFSLAGKIIAATEQIKTLRTIKPNSKGDMVEKEEQILLDTSSVIEKICMDNHSMRYAQYVMDSTKRTTAADSVIYKSTKSYPNIYGKLLNEDLNFKYYYNLHGDVIYQKYNGEKDLINYYTYKYDKYGNWIERQTHRYSKEYGEDITSKINRSIIYY